jgi:hypothetical protein
MLALCLQAHNLGLICSVVNCALGLEKQYPKFKPTYNATYLQLGWNDSKDQNILEGLETAWKVAEVR